MRAHAVGVQAKQRSQLGRAHRTALLAQQGEQARPRRLRQWVAGLRGRRQVKHRPQFCTVTLIKAGARGGCVRWGARDGPRTPASVERPTGPRTLASVERRAGPARESVERRAGPRASAGCAIWRRAVVLLINESRFRSAKAQSRPRFCDEEDWRGHALPAPTCVGRPRSTTARTAAPCVGRASRRELLRGAGLGLGALY